MGGLFNRRGSQNSEQSSATQHDELGFNAAPEQKRGILALIPWVGRAVEKPSELVSSLQDADISAQSARGPINVFISNPFQRQDPTGDALRVAKHIAKQEQEAFKRNQKLWDLQEKAKHKEWKRQEASKRGTRIYVVMVLLLLAFIGFVVL